MPQNPSHEYLVATDDAIRSIVKEELKSILRLLEDLKKFTDNKRQNEFLTVKDIAKELNLDPRTVRSFIQKKWLKGVLTVPKYIKRSDLDQFIKSGYLHNYDCSLKKSHCL